MSISVTNTKSSISVVDDKVTVRVSSGIGPQGVVGPQGPVGPAGAGYTLVAATTTALGGIIVGDNLTVDANGRLSGQQGGVTLLNGQTGVITIASAGGVTAAGGTITIGYVAPPVSSVAGKTGVVSLVKGDVGLGSVDNTADASKPVSTAQAAADAAVQAYAIQRGNHTGTQSAATISDFSTAAVAAVTWTTITGKPSTFTPSAHTHVIADTTGLQAALDGKQDAGSYVLTTDSRLSDSREWSASTVTQAAAEAGTDTTRVAWTVLRVWQAIAAWWAASSAKTKLDGIATGATANQTDAYLLSRANHTGTQAVGTITGLGTLATQSGTFSGTSSGTNTGDQTITLTGDVTGSGTGSFAVTIAAGAVITADIADGAVTTVKIANGAVTAAKLGAHASTHQTGGSDAVGNVVVTPSSLTADTNDWAIGAGDIFRVAGTAARNVTGIAAGTSGQTILLVNVGSFAITLKHASASSTAANRFTVPWAGDCILAASGGNAVLVYDGTSSTWRVL